jgi:hypothetical protein
VFFSADKVIRLDHNQYKDEVRPPIDIPEDVRPFLLSRHQLKSFNSDYLRSALRKTKVNKTFCQLLRGDTVRGVPHDLRNLGNEAFARSIRTHQIIAYFTRYYSLFTTKRPGQVLDLHDPEHKILLDCLRDIVRRVSAKRAIQRPVVDSAETDVVANHAPRPHQHHHHHQQQQHSPAGFDAPSSTPRTIAIGREAHYGNDPGSYTAFQNDDGELSHQGTLVTAVSTFADEKENSAGELDGSFDSTSTIDTATLGEECTEHGMRMSGVHFGPAAHAAAMTPRGGGCRDSFVAYNSVLSMLSDEARRSVEDMVRSIRHKVWEEAQHAVCQRSYDDGRKVGQEEGRMWGMQEALLRQRPATSFPKAAP